MVGVVGRWGHDMCAALAGHEGKVTFTFLFGLIIHAHWFCKVGGNISPEPTLLATSGLSPAY